MESTEQSVPEEEKIHELFLFELDGELFAVAVEQVERVMKIPPITPIPNAPRAIVGIFHLRGRVVVALDLVRRMEMPKQKLLTSTYLFVVPRGKEQFAILIDKPKTIVRVAAKEVHAPDAIIAAHVPPQYILGVFTYEEKVERPKEPSIMIEPAQGSSIIPPSSGGQSRPVLWLDLPKLLDQEDLLRVFASQE